MELVYENYLAHYGVKGMKWGVRKDRSGDRRSIFSKKPKVDPHSDAVEARTIGAKIRKNGAETVSNKELKTLQERQGLQRNTRSFDKNRPRVSDDKATVRKINKASFKKGSKSLSNAELETAIRRMELEVRYGELKKARSPYYKGRGFVEDVIKTAASDLAKDAIKSGISSMAESGAERYKSRF